MKKIYTRGEKAKPAGLVPRFWTYSQNNSGGGFHYDLHDGIGHYVIVEAHDVRHADRIAEGIGLYFGGQGDCSCCGDRWYEAYGSGDEEPMLYGVPLAEEGGDWRYDHEEGRPYVFVHYLDGTVEGWE